MAIVSSAIAASAALGTAFTGLAAKKHFIDKPKEKAEKSARAASAATRQKQDQAAQEAADAEAADAEGSAADETKKKQAAANDESRRSALSNFLAAEGSNTISRRRFLIGAK